MWITTRSLYDRLQGGFTLRYHTAPQIANGQNVQEHSWRAMVILHTLWPDISREALLWTMYHDVSESQIFDMPAPIKWNNPELADMYKRMESMVNSQMGLEFHLDKDELNKCKMADMLELVMHVRLNCDSSGPAWKIYKRGVEYLYKEFRFLEYFAQVRNILVDMDKPEVFERIHYPAGDDR